MYTSRVEDRYPPIGDFVDFLGERIHVIRSGEAGPVVLMIHGASANAREFETTLAPRLSGDFRLLMVDRPGHGYSGRPDASETLEVQAAAMGAVMEQFAPGEPVLVIGHSFGGAVALRVALDYPDRVSGLVLLAPVTHDWGGGGVAWYNSWASPPVLGPIFSQLVPFVGPRAVKAGISDVFAPEPAPENYYEKSGLALLFRPPTFRANARDVVNLQDEIAAQSSRYPELDMPIVVFSGEADTVIKPKLHVHRLKREIEGVEVISYEGGGHMPHHAHADDVIAAITRLAERAPAQ